MSRSFAAPTMVLLFLAISASALGNPQTCKSNAPETSAESEDVSELLQNKVTVANIEANETEAERPPPITAIQVINDLWDGVDVSDDAMLDLSSQFRDQYISTEFSGRSITERKSAGVAANGEKQLLMLGPFDSGTNLLAKLLKRNFGKVPNRFGDWQLWKHGLDTDLSLEDVLSNNVPQGFSLDKIQVIIAVRTPFAQLSSWKKAPYQLKNCTSVIGSGWGSQPCKAPLGWNLHGHGGWNTSGGVPVYFDDIVDAYNHYLGMYRRFEADGRLDIQLVTYEDLVYTPDLVMRSLAERFGWEQPLVMEYLEKPAKHHGSAVGREAALFKLNTRSFLDDFTADDMTSICARLNQTLIDGLSEGSRTNMSRSYFHDCEHHTNAANDY